MDSDDGSNAPSAMRNGPPADPVEAARALAALERSLFGVDRSAKLGRFVLLDQLGRGGMGIVYAAWDPQLQRRVAIKLLRPAAASPKSQSRLLSEARAAARLAHPNVVAIHDVGHADGQVFIAMEYVEGATLTDYGAAEVGLERCVDLFVQAGRGLAAAHRTGLVHRDFKPSNVLVSTDERDELRARVADFGLAQADALVVPPQVTMEDVAHTTHTTVGRAGTPAYMSPEQLGGDSVDARSDQFSFCVALFEAIHGRRPYAAKTSTARLDAIRSGRINPPSGTRVPRRLATALERGLQASPAARHPDMEALLTALAPRRRRGWVLGVAALASVGLAATVAFSLTGEPEPCQDLDLAWNRDVSGQVRAALRAIESADIPSGERLAASTRELLGAHGDSWIEARQDICEATHVRDEQSAALMEIRMACLDRVRVQTEVVLARITHGDVQTMRAAIDVVSGLNSPRSCDALDAKGGSAPPFEPNARARYDETTRQIAEAEADFAFGRWDDGRTRVADALTRLEDAGLARERPRVLALEAAFEARIGVPARAQKTAQEALRLAVSAGSPSMAANIATNLMWIEGKVLGKYDLADRSGELALAWLSASAASPAERASTLDAMGINAFNRDEFDLAQARHREALSLGPPEASRIRIMLNLAAALKGSRQRAASAEAGAILEDALHRAEALYGDESAIVAAILHNAAAYAPTEMECSSARPLLERALEIKEKSYGPKALALASTLGSLAECDLDDARPEAALQRRLRSVGLIETKAGTHSPRLLTHLEGLAAAYAAGGQLEDAEVILDRTEALLVEHYGPDHEYAFGLVRVRATIAGARGEREEERRLLGRSIELAKIAEPESWAVPIIELQRARSWVASGRVDEAKRAAQQIVASLDGNTRYDGVLRDEAQEILDAPN